MSGALPHGVTFNSKAAAFNGVPKPGTGGTYPITITAKNAAGMVTQNFILTVSPS
jgi:hypothetical protein